MKYKTFLFLLIASLGWTQLSAISYSEIEDKQNLELEVEEEDFFEQVCLRRAQENYPYNPHVSIELWQHLSPYFLPIHHPIREQLDSIFKKKRAVLSKEAFTEAGFYQVKMHSPMSALVGKHPKLPGYLVKAFLDQQPPICEWGSWLARITGALSIQDCLNKHGFKDFCVPRKWIYPLPEIPSPPNQLANQRKNFVLVVEDMEILDNDKTLKAYKNKVSRKQLKALFVILTEIGLIDSIYPDNIPFTKKGKIAFIDTEHHHHWPVNYQVFKRYLSPDMQIYWQKLIETNGKVD